MQGFSVMHISKHKNKFNEVPKQVETGKLQPINCAAVGTNRYWDVLALSFLLEVLMNSSKVLIHLHFLAT